jgi:transposase
VAERQRRLPARLRTSYRGALRDWQITDPQTGEERRFRVAYIHSSEEQEETALARERALLRAEEKLRRVQRGAGGRYYKTKADIERRVGQVVGSNIRDLLKVDVGAQEAGKPTLHFERDEEAIEQASLTDGIYALATNFSGRRLSAGQVLRAYKDQQVVERRHRDLKQTLKVRPIFLHNDDRIYALTSIIGIALLVFGLIEAALRKALASQDHFKAGLLPLLPEDRLAKPTGRNILAAFQGLGLTYTPRGIELDRLTFTQQTILELLEVQMPWPQQGR